ncbi:MAG: cyclic nucleotide-binding domain-containing protein [Acidimicrobiales bacterium]
MSRGIPKQLIERLASVPLFAACSRSELRLIAELGVKVTIPENGIVAKQGASGSEFMIVSAGTATCFKDGDRIGIFGPAGFFGELSLLGAIPRTATVVASEQLEVLVLDAREFRRLVDSSPSIARKLLKASALRLAGNGLIQD